MQRSMERVNCTLVGHLFLFLTQSVSPPSWEQLTLILPHESFATCDNDQISLLETLDEESLKNSRIFLLSHLPISIVSDSWANVGRALSKTDVILLSYSEGMESFSLYHAARIKNTTITSPISGELRWSEGQMGDFGGVDVVIAVVKADFYKFDADVQFSPEGQPELHPCFVQELFHILPLALNFTAVLWASEHWGIYNAETSTWRGMIGDLINGDVDLALSSIVHNDQRREVVDFNLDLYSWSFLALFRQPNFRRDPMAFLRPFQSSVWILIVCFLVILSLVLILLNLALIALLSPEERQAMLRLNADNYEKLLDCIFWPIGWICGIGARNAEYETPIRIVIMAGMILGVVLYAYYGGMLISFLTVADAPFSSLQQLLMTSFRFDSMSGDPFLLLQGAPSPDIQEAVSRMVQPLPYVDTGGAREELLKGSYVFLAYDMNAYSDMRNKFNGTESCLIGEISLPVEGQKLGTAVIKGSPFKRPFDYVILKCKQYGLDDRWIRVYLPQRPDCVAENKGGGIPIDSIMIPISVLAFGMAFALFILLVEKAIHLSVTSDRTQELSGQLLDETSANNDFTLSSPWQYDTLDLKTFPT